MLTLTLLLACTDAPPPESRPELRTAERPMNPAPERPVAPAVEGPFEGTAGITDVPRGGEVAKLVTVRTGGHEGYDRVVFEFAAGVPGYHVEYVDKPVRRCGSGEPAAIAGDGWLQIRLQPAAAHDDYGNATVTDRSQHLDLPIARQLELTCDYEADVTWVVGVASPNPYRVLELADPPRLVVDIAR